MELHQKLARLKLCLYIVTIEDSNNCIVSDTIKLNSPAPLIITEEHSDYSTYTISCFGGNNGWIDITVTGGTEIYTYEWDNGEIADINNISAGTYTVTATDSNDNTGL